VIRARRLRLTSLVFATAAGAFVLDRLTKALAEHLLLPAGSVKLIPNVLDLTYTTNRGGAFGLFGSAPYLFLAATLVVCVAIVIASFGVTRPLVAVGMGLVLGGALGNLTDRIIRGSGLDGRVVDFIHITGWPVFNVADSAIVIGAGLILLGGLRHRA
jgi:signal peptidase II